MMHPLENRSMPKDVTSVGKEDACHALETLYDALQEDIEVVIESMVAALSDTTGGEHRRVLKVELKNYPELLRALVRQFVSYGRVKIRREGKLLIIGGPEETFVFEPEFGDIELCKQQEEEDA